MQRSPETAEVAPTIVALRKRLESVRQNEVERVSRREVSFGPEQQDAIEELTHGIVTSILHGPVKVLETESDDEESAALVSLVHRIFNLGDEPTGRPSNCPRSRGRTIAERWPQGRLHDDENCNCSPVSFRQAKPARNHQ